MHVKFADFKLMGKLIHIDIDIDVRIDIKKDIVRYFGLFMECFSFHGQNCTKKSKDMWQI